MSLKSRIKNILKAALDERNLPAQQAHCAFKNVDIQNGCIISSDTIIGEFTYIGFNCTVTKATIGRYCSIANNVSIGDGEHALTDVSTSSHFYEDIYNKLTAKDCVIGNDVWIGAKSIIRRGVVIGNGAVIGANTFVNKDVPDFAVVVGSPARVIKYRFNNEAIELIKNSHWWNLTLEEARSEVAKITLLIK